MRVGFGDDQIQVVMSYLSSPLPETARMKTAALNDTCQKSANHNWEMGKTIHLSAQSPCRPQKIGLSNRERENEREGAACRAFSATRFHGPFANFLPKIFIFKKTIPTKSIWRGILSFPFKSLKIFSLFPSPLHCIHTPFVSWFFFFFSLSISVSLDFSFQSICSRYFLFRGYQSVESVLSEQIRGIWKNLRFRFPYEFVPEIFSNGEFLTGPVKNFRFLPIILFLNFFISFYIADLKKKEKVRNSVNILCNMRLMTGSLYCSSAELNSNSLREDSFWSGGNGCWGTCCH